ncbi:MAG TPA: aminotransferase class V-fold PLP-dependent enzyme [Symbiobacteriaceae bacterium]|jgi:selenocysteine lyase/cysteine desulfurase
MAVLPPQRDLFDIPDDVAYFNCAYNSPLLNESRARLLLGAGTKSHPWERTPDDFFRNAETIRALASAIFGGDADGYAVVPAASYGLSTAARAIEPHLRPGDRIVVINEEFPSNYLPWKRTAQESGADIVTVPTPAHGDWTRAILDAIDKTVRVVAVSSCHWTNGAYIDLAAIGKACREVDAVFVVDATQSLGAMPLSIEDVRPDFLVAAGYKWLLCPYGFGLVYVSERWRGARPLEETWLARDNAEDFTALVKYSDAYMPGARRFDVGEKCTATILPGAIAALEQIKAWGVTAIAESLAAVNGKIASHLEQLGFQLPEPAQRCPHMFGAQLPSGYAGNLVAELRTRKIFISQRGSALRFAPHLHVTNRDIDRLLDSLDHIVR